MIYKPHEYQVEALKFLFRNRYNALFLDMGLGKTVITLTAMSLLLKNKQVNKILVIAPLRVAQSTWSQEIDKWDHLKHLRVSKIIGKPKARIEALNTDAEIYITNVDNLTWLYKNMPKKDFFDYLILDELSLYKNKETNRFKALIQLRPHAKGVTGLTGTPAPNSLLDLWAPICLLDLGERLGGYNQYRNRYFHYTNVSRDDTSAEVPDSRGGKFVIKPGAEKIIYEKLKDLALTMQAVDYLKMPERIDNFIKVELNKKDKESYNEMAENAYTMLCGGDEIQVKDMIALSGKLMQLSNGRAYDSNKNVVVVHDAKLNKLEELVETNFGKPVLVLTHFKCDNWAILNRIKGSRQLLEDKDITDWNSGKIPVLIANPRSCGHGLNLQGGGHTIIWYGLTWSLELYQQANARIYRQGQESSTVVINHIIAEDTIDGVVLGVLEGKYRTQDELLQALKQKKFVYK